jgi:hypothetical protein
MGDADEAPKRRDTRLNATNLVIGFITASLV